MSRAPFEYEEQEILLMSVTDVALAILSDIDDRDEWNAYNWMNSVRHRYDAPTLQRLAEGWQWLFSKGAVASDYGTTESGGFFVTELGESLVADGLGRLVAEERLGLELHPLLEGTVRRQYLLGEYELAVFAAFREVEIRVRELISAPGSEVGVTLMRSAFDKPGVLRQFRDEIEGELDAYGHLYAGAMGVFKNPTSHRIVDYSDPVLAVETILFADLLLRMLDPIAEEASKHDPVLEAILAELRERGIGRT